MKTFKIEKTTKTVACCGLPLGISPFEIEEAKSLFKATMRDKHIGWDTISTQLARKDLPSFTKVYGVLVATVTSLKIEEY